MLIMLCSSICYSDVPVLYKSLYDLDTSYMDSYYRINKKQFEKDTDYDVYKSFMYPYFKYPFHYVKDIQGNDPQKTLYYSTNNEILSRYPGICDIHWSQPEFNMLKRCFDSKEYSFKKLNYDTNDGAEGGGVPSNFNQVINIAKTTKGHGTFGYGYGQVQGFIEGLYTNYTFYIAEKVKGEEKGHRFLFVLPSSVKITELSKYKEVWILFLGTCWDYEQTYVTYNIDVVPWYFYPVMDVIILYDKRIYKDYPW